MSEFLQSEAGIRVASFALVFAAMAAWEVVAPRRALAVKRPLRWSSNLGLVFLNSLLLRLIAPLGAVGVAWIAENEGWGLLNVVSVPNWLSITLSVVLLDLAIYFQHVMFHAVPLFWRLHMVHHADMDIDVTTGVRFHTIEILLSFGIKSVAILLLGPPPVAVLIFEVLLNAMSMFNHSNVYLPLGLDHVLRWFVVTPDMHRVHHSWHRHETDSNFGFNHPWWDWIFLTYRDQPRDGHLQMTLGVKQIRDEKRAERLPGMLSLPFLRITDAPPKDESGLHAGDPTRTNRSN